MKLIQTVLSLSLLWVANAYPSDADAIVSHDSPDEEFEEVAAAFRLSGDLVRQSYLRGVDQDARVSADRKSNKDMSGRDIEWLDSNNNRRKEYHEQYGKTYVPLTWSNGLKQEAQAFADELVKDCKNKAPSTNYGAWAAMKQGPTKLQSTESVLNNLVRKLEMGSPQRDPIIQVLWRATKYIGCADAVSAPGATKTCTSSVCYYAKPGNCAMGKYTDWQTPTFADDSKCPPACPPDVPNCEG